MTEVLQLVGWFALAAFGMFGLERLFDWLEHRGPSQDERLENSREKLGGGV